MSDWAKEKEQKRLDRLNRSLQRALAAPPARGEMLSSISTLQQHVTSVAIAIEALEILLMTAGILKENELMEQIESLIKAKAEAAQAAEAAEQKGQVQLAS